ncbi:hypothetical protein M0R45_011524 [Rubus argutus]|uniref:Uncharacterized protein n=1 Tax=Rubus argutus TaxID=59490 RepID=A0AAW1YBC5_RUBAR
MSSQRLRDVKEKAYTPQVVSLGPLHHGAIGLQAMEGHKIRYVREFFERSKVSLQDCYNYLMSQEAKIRACYAVAIEFNEHKLVEMILVDAIFTFEFLLRSAFKDLQQKNDRIFGKPRMDRDVIYDMLLLENQIPFFILEYIHFLAVDKHIIPLKDNRVLSLLELTHIFLQNRVYIRPFGEMMDKLGHGARITHFVDFVLKCHRPSLSELPRKERLETLTIPSATELHQAGVKFVNCELHDHYINDYVFVIDRLVDNSKDVELLVQNKILESKLPDSQAAADFINSLDLGPILFSRDFYFTQLCKQLNDYYDVPWHKWKESLKQDYFSTPWVGLSVIVAAILLVLTLIQTVCSVIAM